MGTQQTITEARRCALAVVRSVLERGTYADVVFRAEADRLGLGGRERSFAMRLAYGTVQRRATLDHLIERLADRRPADLDAPTLAALRLGLYQVAYMGGVADHAAVAESVELAKAEGSRGHGLVNAVLRRATREGQRLIAELDDSTAAGAALAHSHPVWIAELWWRTLGPEQARELMQCDNEPAESAARANTLRTTAEEIVATLRRDEIGARRDPLVPEAVVLEEPYDLHGSALFTEGRLMPQSRASMLVAHALDPRAGESVLDLCAAPGAKTTHVAALMRDEGRILAVDVDPARAASIAANCRRLGVGSVQVEVADASAGSFGSGYDRVLVDPPCSDLGTLQSRPDARWRKLPRDVEELAELQERILDVAAGSAREGGRIVYSTCTISERENEQQIARFLKRHSGFSPVDLSAPYPALGWKEGGGFLQTLPHRDKTDGFFVAALERR